MKKIFFLLLLFVSINNVYAQSKDEAIIRNTLALQEKYWNAGNIDSFMIGYWQNDSLMFIGKEGVTYGFERTLENYKKGYPDTLYMGKLHFDLLEVKRLSVMYFFVVGKWHLTRGKLGDVGGHFTLLFKKVKDKWVIVADHSS